jgi:hypothetical protein
MFPKPKATLELHLPRTSLGFVRVMRNVNKASR